MFIQRRTRLQKSNPWPIFVDVLSSVIMSVLFVLMTFIVAQFYLSHILHQKDNELAGLETFVSQLKKDLAKTEHEKKAYLLQMKQLETLIKNLTESVDSKQLENKTLCFNAKALEQNMEVLQKALEATRLSSQKTNETLAEKINELQKLKSEYEALQCLNVELQKRKLTQFQSEFFAALQQIIGKRQDIRVVDDRFMFQSEVLFGLGSAQLETQGKKELDGLASIILELSKKIPKDIHWILRIDGHTDTKPIKDTSRFASNWELSSARALCVLKYLVEKGIAPSHLVAAGFGEHQPISKDSDKNRRIEFKLDQR